MAVRFPLGRYHATPWNRSVNEGAVEWPPSPWRILRGLLATRHTRWPDLSGATVDTILNALAGPPSYRTPDTRPGHTRHYMPDAEHMRGATGNTDLALDPFLTVSHEADLLVSWDVDLDPDVKEALNKLAEMLPYLGRAESVCEARVLTTGVEPGPDWWRPMDAHDSEEDASTVRLLAPVIPVSRSALEQRPLDVRKARRTVPESSRWIEYVAPQAEPVARSQREDPRVTAVLLSLSSRAPFRAEYGVLAADVLRSAVLAKFKGWDEPAVTGRAGGAKLASQHRHAHWIPLADEQGDIDRVLVWAPEGLTTDAVSRLLRVRDLWLHEDRSARGFRPSRVALAGAGSVERVAPWLVGPARRWVTRTPYLPVRHRKREDMQDFVADDIGRELSFRGLPEPVGVDLVHPSAGDTDGFARPWRRYRLKESMAQRRPGVAVRLTFQGDVPGPIALGALSHFGFGLFVPMTE